MKTIKNNVINKRLGLIFIVFSFFINTATVFAFYEYRNPDETKTEICQYAIDDLASCNERVKSVCGPTTTGVCVPSSSGCNSSAVAVICPTPDVQEITGQKTTGPTDVYTLLAPIGELTTAPKDVGDYFNTIFLIAIGLCGALAVIMIVIGGIQYMGDESIFGKTEAKSRITSAIFGLLIALGAYALLNTINPDLLGGGGVNIKQVSAGIDAETESTPWSGSAEITGTTKTCTEGYINISTLGNNSQNQPKTINVCKSVSSNLQNLINKAKESGYILSGWGSRSYDQQVKLRQDNHCPDVYNSSSSDCNPPTARPGHSKHESGKAIDFTCNGSPIAGTACFQWLKTNASKYGFYNLVSEPWHWSDNGH